MSDVNFELLTSLIRETRDAVLRVENRQKVLEDKVDVGFTNLRAHDFTHHTDMAMMERRVTDLEVAIDRINHTEGINAPE